MKVRVLKDPYHDFKVGDIYQARPAPDGKNYMVESLTGQWLCMYPREIQFICHGVAVCETSSGDYGAK